MSTRVVNMAETIQTWKEEAQAVRKSYKHVRKGFKHIRKSLKKSGSMSNKLGSVSNSSEFLIYLEGSQTERYLKYVTRCSGLKSVLPKFMYTWILRM